MQDRAEKSLILTTGAFKSDARKEAARDGVPPIELLDSQKMIDLFVDFGAGAPPGNNQRGDRGVL